MVEVNDLMLFNLILISVPFVIWGMWGFSNWLIGLLKTRRGFYSVRWINQNHQEQEKLVKPNKANQIKVDGKPRPFFNDPKHFILRGSRKIIAFSKLGERITQLSFASDSKQDKEAPPGDLFDEMLMESEQFGKMMGVKPNPLMLILALVAAGGIVIVLLSSLGIYQMLNVVPKTTSDLVANSSAITGIPSATFDKIAPMCFNKAINGTVIP